MSTTANETDQETQNESTLLATNSLDDFDQMSSSLEEIKSNNFVTSTDKLGANSNDDLELSTNSIQSYGRDEDLTQDASWPTKDRHIFVLSLAGKPVYTRYGSEDKLAWLFGVMQTLVSFVQSNDDSVKSIEAGDTKFYFLVRKPLILVSVSKKNEGDIYLNSQLNYVYNQIASILTATRLNKIYEQRQNYDLRRLLTGAERLVDRLIDFSEKQPAFVLGAIQCLPLAAAVRNNISSAIIGACHKKKNVVFAVLLADNKLITLVRMKKYSLHPADLHLIFNLVQSFDNIKTSESWTPICLPLFDSSGFLYAHVSYLAEDCQACLLLLTVEREMFYSLRESKQQIVEKLRRNNCLEAINESLLTPEMTSTDAGFPEIRHYLYKSKSTMQFYQPRLGAPYNIRYDYMMSLYKRAHQVLHCPTRSLKLYLERSAREAVFAWDTQNFELYAIFEPLVETVNVSGSINRLLNWINEKEDKLFHLNVPTF